MGEISPHEGMRNFAGGIFSIWCWGTWGVDFDYSNLFQNLKHSVNTQHQLKSKLARPVCAMPGVVCTVCGEMTTAKN